MQTFWNSLLVLAVLVGLSFLYYHSEIGSNVDATFLTISTFVFSIFTGFFIARQGARYTKIREVMASFDGRMSALYRTSGHLGVDVQGRVAEILEEHYKKFLASNRWDYYFTHKTSTLVKIHEVLEQAFGGKESLPTLQSSALGGIMRITSGAQDNRKNMIALYQERIPLFHWFLILFLMFLLLATVSTFESANTLLPSILKAAFASSVVAVILILYRLDTLSLFEGTIGKNSAKDVLNIIQGTK